MTVSLSGMESFDQPVIIAPGPRDAAALGRTHVQAWRETYTGLLPQNSINRLSTEVFAGRFYQQLVSKAPVEVLLAAEGIEGIVGYCSGRPIEDGMIAEITSLYLLRSVQKLGLGRRLLVSAARTFQARGARSMRLWVLDRNDAARGFYEHLGAGFGGSRRVNGWGGGFRESSMVWSDISRLARAD